ncbi:uncharacterized protein LOC121795566 isoform X2 [Salvia splendens]|uniref:uncharacterized protein LOC121795566 isoform X2 n=1 Tax=Salvia splendens TaxID=180675 RepID=UPI001C268B06|nr:uncharacterized protein LOC121795566 isoform X2 [Salvia splendens]
MSGHQAQEKYEVKASSSKGVENIQCSSIFGQFSEKEIITQLKGLARNPSMPQFAIDNIQPLWTQILGLRKLMALEASEMPWRKRKLEQLVKDTLRAPAGFVSPHQQNMAKCRRRQSSQASSSLSCLLNSIDSAHSHDDKFIFESLVTFDEAFPEKQRKHLEPSHRSISLLNFIGDHLQRKVIPVGPRFQTDIPEWDDTVDMSIRISSYKSDSDNLKWLGSQVWPIVTRNMKSTRREIGKGKNIFCSCASRASADCIKRLVCEDRLLLQHDLGPAFSSWKFDEMGEQVSESWSLKEQRAYESLMKMRPSANGKSFWKRTLKRLPRKSKKDIVNYYFNVYIPHRMSLHRSSPTINQVDTDDEDEDEADNSDHKGLQKGAEGRSPTIPNKKARYLRTS